MALNESNPPGNLPVPEQNIIYNCNYISGAQAISTGTKFELGKPHTGKFEGMALPGNQNKNVLTNLICINNNCENHAVKPDSRSTDNPLWRENVIFDNQSTIIHKVDPIPKTKLVAPRDQPRSKIVEKGKLMTKRAFAGAVIGGIAGLLSVFLF